MQWRFARRAEGSVSSAVREILKVTERSEVISFAGGLPAVESFPLEALREASRRVFEGDDAESALQYATTEGYAPLRQWIAARLSRDGVSIDPRQVLLTTGSQQALDLIGKALIDPGDRVLVETPTYLGALQAFRLYEPDFVSLPSDDQGLDPEALNAALLDGAKCLYTIPNFQNPTGRRLPLARRQALAALAEQRGLTLIEDDPYGELDYQGAHLPSLLALAPRNTLHLGSFSKVLSPGMRLGYVVGPVEVIDKLVQLKQASDLHTAGLTQRIVFEAVKDGLLERHLPQVRKLYARRCEAMLDALARHMPQGVHWHRPEGGMFIWVELPAGVDASLLFERAIAEDVAFVPGAPFYANQAELNTLRLAFVTVDELRIEAGIARLGALLGEMLEAEPASVVGLEV
ncbi:aminotransferase-like domain-containing protein [Halotalea alkalilenta]|uniref:2-aminoadipate aminotransferase n=1 Tax=Halotalea alkalilenta TaxID=376489 RepID=A0A172YDR9_9GAMM|nr:PLP-dependent aminotransferase family protein [Halotalea alkalilenta]ANF57115.1 2-aminoadipate aminotransferase [Halotalea alkalilenta]